MSDTALCEWMVQNEDAISGMEAWPDGHFNCCVTSPPYYGLRAYKTQPLVWGGSASCLHSWSVPVVVDHRGTQIGKAATVDARESTRGCWCTQGCGAWRGELGLEPSPELYVAHLVEVFEGVRRVLREDGVCWVVVGDSYAGGGGFSPNAPSNLAGSKQATQRGAKSGGIRPQGSVKAKDLIGIPWRLAFALQSAGWYLRADIIWHKPNAMPSSQKDRPTLDYEHVFMLTKRERYWYDGEAVKEPRIDPVGKKRGGSLGRFGPSEKLIAGEAHRGDKEYESNGSRSLRSVWSIGTQPYKGAHFATFPEALVRPMILSSCPADGWVIDPFAGSGTTLKVARDLGRNSVGMELNPDYCELIRQRMGGAAMKSETEPHVHTTNQ